MLWQHNAEQPIEFQSHLRPIHPIHSLAKRLRFATRVSIASAPHPPYPLLFEMLLGLREASFNRICAPSTLSTSCICSVVRWGRVVSIASAPHPPYPQCLLRFFDSDKVSIASAPHPPYPHCINYAGRSYLYECFNRICAPSTLSTCLLKPRLQRCIVSIASAPHPPYPHYIK